MGILSSLRSSVNGGLYVGTVITASHNMVCDNGIKIIDYDGGMLSQEWEPLAEEISRIVSVEELHSFISRIANDSESSLLASGGCVLIGRDTRPHSKELVECVKLGIQVAGGTYIDFGELTTPQLHFIVSRSNQMQVPQDSLNIQAGIDDYFNTLSTGYVSLLSTLSQQEKTHIIIDGSFGIGGRVVNTLSESIKALNPNLLEIDVRNRVGEGDVNQGCGAEIVQKERRPPCGVREEEDANRLLCSFDGDGDRIVFHAFLHAHSSSSPPLQPPPLAQSPPSPSPSTTCTWSLIDGDKIASILAVFLCEEMKHANLDKSFSIGLVQTAYANGASRNFMIGRGLNPVMAKTGVKFLHHKATHFDMGLYFEANGHGTVLFSKSLISAIERGCDDSEDDDRVKIAFTRLQVG
jgi:phosphoacetylglucosamine mutase